MRKRYRRIEKGGMEGYRVREMDGGKRGEKEKEGFGDAVVVHMALK